MLQQVPGIRCLRDPTRGGLATSLNEIATASRVGIKIREATVPVRAEVWGARNSRVGSCCTWRMKASWVAFVAEEQADGLVAAMRTHPLGRDAAIIGKAVGAHPGLVTLQPTTGGGTNRRPLC